MEFDQRFGCGALFFCARAAQFCIEMMALRTTAIVGFWCFEIYVVQAAKKHIDGPAAASLPSPPTFNLGPWACDPPCKSGFKCVLDRCILEVKCPNATKFGTGPPSPSSLECKRPRDPNNLPPSQLERWFTREVFEDLFPKANIGWGPHICWPYSYDAFVIAARYFPDFGIPTTPSGAWNLTHPENLTHFAPEQLARRDLAAFFAHAVQETGENDASLYDLFKTSQEKADACFYRGGFFNWFEGGPISSFLPPKSPGYRPEDGDRCTFAGQYCISSAELDFFYPCNKEKLEDDSKQSYFKGCYFGRGAVQISYNFNYGQFQQWLKERRIEVDLMNEPNLVMTKMDPPLAILASLWFYMTPQPPKPAMHDIVFGNWEPGDENRAAGYEGPIFGPTSLVINNECNGEDPSTPGGPGESRRIKAFKWFSQYFGLPVEDDRLLTCKGMPRKLDQLRQAVSYQPDWSSTWKDQRSCDCAPAGYGGMIPYFDEKFYPPQFVEHNKKNRIRCVQSIYSNPKMYSMTNDTNRCLDYVPPEMMG